MDDEVFYETVVEELERAGPKKGLWAKAFSTANGNENVAKAYYLDWRVKQLKEEYEFHQNNRREILLREKEKDTKAEQQRLASIGLVRRLRPLAIEMRNVGLSVDVVIIQLTSKGLTSQVATDLANEVFS